MPRRQKKQENKLFISKNTANISVKKGNDRYYATRYF